MNRLRMSVLMAMVLVSVFGCGALQNPLFAVQETDEKPSVTIRGSIKTKFGQPIGRVKVSIESYDQWMKNPFVANTMTDEDGKFQFENVVSGSYRVFAEKHRWESEEKLFTVQDGVVEDEIILPIVMELTCVVPDIGLRAIR